MLESTIDARDSEALNLAVAAAAVVAPSYADDTILFVDAAAVVVVDVDVAGAALSAFVPLDLTAALVSTRAVSAKCKRRQLEGVDI